MKRSRKPIARYTPMPRSTKPLARTRMKPVSKRTAAIKRKVRPFREAYLDKHLTCELCLRRVPQHVHEIHQGSYREKSLDVEHAVLALCATCHRDIHDKRKWPVSRQIALKVVRSPELFGCTMDHVCELRGNGPKEIENADVFKHLELRE